MSDLLSGHHALVTGAASGIGAAVASAFRDAGATVLAADLKEAPGIVACDVRSEQDVARAFVSAEEPLTDVVHCAGIAEWAPIEEVSLEQWHRIIETNLTGSFLVAREAARALRAPGSLTFIASAGGLKGSATWCAYGSSKFGVVGLARSLGQELAPRRLRVNAVCPGGVWTPMAERTAVEHAQSSGVPLEAVRRGEDERVPIGRMALPGQVASVCVFLASEMASHVAGAALLVDGAQLA